MLETDFNKWMLVEMLLGTTQCVYERGECVSHSQ